ncbi:MAG TPA: hypothetical protein VIY96_02680 [Thermoanaerobaculia bacterium]
MARRLRIPSRCLALAIVAAIPWVARAEGLDLEDRGLAVERLHFNLLSNSRLVSRASSDDVAIPQWMTVSGASSTAPIEVSTSIPHRLTTGDAVLIKGVLGNLAANGWWTVTVTGEKTFALDDSEGDGIYAGGGSVFPAAGQPPVPGAQDAAGDLPWTPWFSAPAVARETEFFQSTGEVYTFPEVPPVNSFLSQEIDGSLFHAGENLCLSIEARMPVSAIGDQRLKMVVTAAFRRIRVYAATYPAALLTPEYQRIALCFRLDNDAVTAGGVLRVEFIDEHLRGIPKPMFWTRPMLNEGIAPAAWAPDTAPRTRTRAFR